MECPLCNGLKNMAIDCKKCGLPMRDKGKLMDYADDYSAYLDITIQKQTDGVRDSLEEGLCVHLFKCPSCYIEETKIIQEEND